MHTKFNLFFFLKYMININQLNNIRDKRKLNREYIYKKVLNKCINRIKLISNLGESYCFYIIPEYIYGIPKYNILNCSLFIKKTLENKGFKIVYTSPNLFFISWYHIPSEISESNYKNIKIKNTQKFKKTNEYKNQISSIIFK